MCVITNKHSYIESAVVPVSMLGSLSINLISLTFFMHNVIDIMQIHGTISNFSIYEFLLGDVITLKL